MEEFYYANGNNVFLDRRELIAQAIYKKKIQLKGKRVLDIILSIILILLLSPLLITVSILIVLSSKGPVFYSNKRIGLFEPFNCLKFRSMVIDHLYSKEDLQAYLEAKNKGVLFKVKQDGRVTGIGKIIRKTSIDELPQLFNVLKGEMSIVGPRPLVPHMLNNYVEFNQTRSILKPGITGKWQIEDRINNTSAQFMIEPDLNYLESFSLLTDLKIILKTPIAILNANGAY